MVIKRVFKAHELERSANFRTYTGFCEIGISKYLSQLPKKGLTWLYHITNPFLLDLHIGSIQYDTYTTPSSCFCGTENMGLMISLKVVALRGVVVFISSDILQFESNEMKM